MGTAVNRREIEAGARVVVKVGSSSLSLAGGGVDRSAIERTVAGVSASWNAGHPTVLVTSAAISAGLPLLGMTARPMDLPSLQVAAAVGQSSLMASYNEALARFDRIGGQVLLTRDILGNRGQYLHARAALSTMLELGVIPIVNENDTVVVDEVKLGDNDRLAAIVAHLVGASLLIILTDTHGLYSGDPRTDGSAELLEAVQHTDQILDELSRSTPGPLGSGGVGTKVAAARMAAWSGIPTVIAAASEPDVVSRIIAGDAVGTWVEPHPSSLSARKLWIAFGQPAQGSIRIDAGAVKALAERRGSLLPVGVVAVAGNFDRGDAVEVLDPDQQMLAKGQVRVAADRLRSLAGKRTHEIDTDGWGGVVIHADDLVLLRS